MTYYIGVHDDTNMYIPNSLTNDKKLTEQITQQWRTHTAMKNASKAGIQPNTDIQFYLNSILVHTKKMSSKEFDHLPKARHQILDHTSLKPKL